MFHYQKNFLDERFIDLVCEGKNAEQWVEELGRELERYFQFWFGTQKNVGEKLPEI